MSRMDELILLQNKLAKMVIENREHGLNKECLTPVKKDAMNRYTSRLYDFSTAEESLGCSDIGNCQIHCISQLFRMVCCDRSPQ